MGKPLSLDEIEDFRKSLKNCPQCGSTQGFWLIAKQDKTYLQCKDCRAILEFCQVHPPQKTTKESKRFLAKIKLVR